MSVLIKAKGKIENGQLVLDAATAPFPRDGEVEVMVILKENQSANFSEVDLSIKDAAINIYDQTLDLIQNVKREKAEKNIILSIEDIRAGIRDRSGFRTAEEIDAYLQEERASWDD
ncbi:MULTISPECIES: hypothetical protein [Cyanophyceae]|uniref:hypothetical protein n=1 Tax=Cyanophyceae TaxID=3028117 RepID=UPI00016DCE84|nr:MULTISPECIES: hypothetical protein [Cyanophyceae]ACB00950.1 hypothetical protein SYNPCC7002_F0019 [Picosynechococcus sp. PCC 7002]SMH58573.1 hypothetical protein SAMN06272755_3220 [Picosynechococcus sp. OG1]SMQ86465.1 hypothetical protein SAMN06272774_3212 [Synechococcus sp. 7002]